MLEFSLYFGPGYFVAYFLVMKLCESCSFLDYINEKPIRAYISIAIIFTVFILTSGTLDTLIKSNNIENLFSGLRIGALIALLKGIKITKLA